MDFVDVAVVGAGSAGLGAANALANAKRNFVVLEAADRICGRVFCDSTTFPGIPFDHGGAWFHMVTAKSLLGGSETNNPLYDIAHSRGLAAPSDLGERYLMANGARRNFLLHHGVVTLGLVVTAVLWAAGKTALGHADDISVEQATSHLKENADYDQVWGLLAAEHGASPARMSCLDLLNLMATARLPVITPSWDNHRCPSGMGNFLATFAEGMPIRLNSPVKRIAWGRKDGVTLETSGGTLKARTAIVTVSIGVLAADAIAFDPTLPATHSKAVGGLEMGHTAKIGVLFDRNVFDEFAPNSVTFPDKNQRLMPLVQTRPWDNSNFAIVIVGGDEVADMERRGGNEDYAREQIALLFGSDTAKAITKTFSSSWNTNPLTRGGYSSALPGGTPGRKVLAEEALANQVFFAGEATSTTQHSSIHGAYISGQNAAKRAIKTLA
jgi:monoamine oxidase